MGRHRPGGGALQQIPTENAKDGTPVHPPGCRPTPRFSGQPLRGVPTSRALIAAALSVGLSLPALAGEATLSSSAEEEEEASCGVHPDCVGPEGYEPPEYSAVELLTFLSDVPAVAADPASLFTGFWTNWDDEPTERGLVKLAVIRGIVEARNLHHPYLPGALTDNLAEGDIVCGEEVLEARTADGTCNDLRDPAAGAVLTRFGRNVPLAFAYPDPTTMMTPDPRRISRVLLQRRGGMEEIPFLNMWAAAWTQFMIHDWFDHGEPDLRRPIRVPLDPRDPIRRRTGQTEIVFGSTPLDSSRLPSEAGLPPTYLNDVTHWWDGSQVYGSDAATADRLRTFKGGHLALTSDGLLPKNPDGIGDTGFNRNWWVGLELLHTLFAREHNAIADHLAAAYPGMSDQELYDKARLINAALMAKIHTLEWTPAILPNKKLDLAMNANWYGLERFVDPDPVQQATLRTLAPPPSAEIYGIMGGPTDDKGVPFSITAEFAAIYRMHQLTPDLLELRTERGRLWGRLPTVRSTDAGGRRLVERMDPEALAVSFGQQRPGALVLRNYPRFMTRLETFPGNEIDLATIDIVRDRERGIPRYNAFRALLNLPPLSSIDDLTPDPRLRAALKRVYTDIDEVDLFVGTLAEAERPECFGFGETLFQTFILMASRRLQADRFFTVDYTPDVYTPEGLDWIEDNTFKDVLLRHHPDLANTGLQHVDNAFNPWEEDWSLEADTRRIGERWRDRFEDRGGFGDDEDRWDEDEDDRWDEDEDEDDRWDERGRRGRGPGY